MRPFVLHAAGARLCAADEAVRVDLPEFAPPARPAQLQGVANERRRAQGEDRQDCRGAERLDGRDAVCTQQLEGAARADSAAAQGHEPLGAPRAATPPEPPGATLPEAHGSASDATPS
eukprot:6161037-Prymnesium_polylepis.1